MPRGRHFRFRKHSAHTPSKHQDYLLSLHNTRMSQFLPHATYAEDQRYSYAILTGHVLYRGFAAGALVGALAPLPIMIFRPLKHPLPLAVLRSAGMGTVVGTGVLALALAGRMYGREEIEWKDRSWRLLANKGQVEVDTWSGVGTVMGALVARGKGWRGRLGGAGLGNLVGVGGYLGWRYGFNQGKFNKGKWEEDAV
ncbi:hypothetical protein VE00_07992 [Pseudogymnoascus sp. WSF 3629]|nr:hypothetical protein VE00_07992 [Pseudogymnoascus sp. WSF 3629]